MNKIIGFTNNVKGGEPKLETGNWTADGAQIRVVGKPTLGAPGINGLVAFCIE
jgi:hypothetical protein